MNESFYTIKQTKNNNHIHVVTVARELQSYNVENRNKKTMQIIRHLYASRG